MKKIISLLICLALLTSVGYTNESRAEVDSGPAYDENVTVPSLSEDDYEVRVLTNLGIIQGRGNGLDLDADVTRAEAIVLVERMAPRFFHLIAYTEPFFSDIDGHWAEDTIDRNGRAGLFNGFADSCFEPEKPVSAGEFAMLLLRAMGYRTADLNNVYELGVEHGLLVDNHTKTMVKNNLPLTRGGACRICYSAFFAVDSEYQLLYRRLIEQGVYTEDELMDLLVAEDTARVLTFADRLNSSMPDDRNYMFSPMSIKMALAMAANGAEGETREQILDVLQISDLEAYNSYARQLIADYADGPVTVDIANSLWINEDMTDRQFSFPYQATIKNFYDGEARTVNSDSALREVNGWVNEHTGGKIPSIINDPYFETMLINAVYFRGTWMDEFSESMTSKEIFTQLDGERRATDFMNMTEYFSACFTDRADMISLPYQFWEHVYDDYGDIISSNRSNNMISMYIVKPKVEELNVQAEIEKALGEKSFDSKYISLSLPKFKIEYEENLNNILINMGMEKAFGSSAEFETMFGEKNDMRILDVIHKTYIDVNERGTEAAAITVPMAGASERPPEPIGFRVDSPFAFVIRDDTNGEILFMGEYAYVE